MFETRIRTPVVLWPVAILLFMVAIFAIPMEARASADDITVTMDVQIALTLDNSDPADKKMTGEGTVYGSCINGASHGFVRASVPDSLTMTTPAGNKAAPEGTRIDFTASINARKGRANYEAKNGLNGKSLSDLMKGKVRVTVPLTEDFLDYGAGNYSLRIPITFTMTKAYGSYDESLDFTPWETLMEEGKVTVEDGRLKTVEKGDVILEIDPSIASLGSPLFSKSTYREVVIPPTVTASDSGAVAGSVEKVIFEDGFTRIPDRICEGGANITSVTLPDAVEYIGKYAFSKCTGLVDFSFPTSLNYLGTCAFQKCTGIEEMTVWNDITTEASLGTLSPFYGAAVRKATFKEGVTKIPGYLFYNGCQQLEEMYLPSTLESIGQSAFPNATKLKEITVRSNLTNDYGTPFSGSGLERITFVDGVTSIPKNLFSGGCASLTDLYIPASVTAIGGDVFKGCSSLTEFTVKNNLTVSGTVSPFRGSGFRRIYFTEDVTTIPKYLFEDGCGQLETLDFPAHITKVEAHAFGKATSLGKVTVRSDMAETEGVVSPFYKGDIREIEIEEGVTEIPKYFFGESVSSLTALSLPRTLQSIGVGAFKGCSSLPSLDLPEGVATIEGRAFEGCTSLKSIVIKRNITFSGSVSPFYGSGLESITFREGVTEILSYMFGDGCENLTSLYLPASIQTIGTNAFRGCSSLTELVIRSDVSVPGVISPFSGSGLTSVSFQDGVTKIPGHMFDGGCGSLTAIYLPASIESVGSGAFEGCSSLTELVIRSDIATPGTPPFAGNALETLTFTSGVTKVADFLLNENCGSLETLNLPVSLRTIGLDAFGGGERITARYAGTEVQWASVNRNGWEPYAVVFGAAQPQTVKMTSGSSAPSRSLKSIMGTSKADTKKGAESGGKGEVTKALTPSQIPMYEGELNNEAGQ